MLLQLVAAGLHWDDLPWLEPPPREWIASAENLLNRLGATREGSSLTALGREMALFELHPRLARFLIEAVRLGARVSGCEVSARLSSGRSRVDMNPSSRSASDVARLLAEDLDYTTRRVRDQLLARTKSIAKKCDDSHALEKALLVAYPDRLCRRRGETMLLSEGGSANLRPTSIVQDDFLLVLEMESRSQQGLPVVSLTSAIEPDWLLEYFPNRIQAGDELVWNREAERVEQVSILRYDKLIVDETSAAPRDPQAASALLSAKALEAGLEKFIDVDELNAFLCRARFAQQHASAAIVPDNLVESALQILAGGLTSFRQLRDAARDGGFLAVLQAALPMGAIDEIAPTHIFLPSGRRARIDYHDAQPPSVAPRLQDFFGMAETPRVARGSVPLVVQLLAPNHRPMQVTTDLASFWRNLYPQLRRELGHRYPKHAWPEDPTLTLSK
jgi:ATP-dependent helicase HrpB